jgi:pyruvate dehydrogenase E2 component (dihydrolipoamide acetyltransferase)
MAFEFKLPDLGEGVAEGEVVKWLVAAGDEVAEDQPLAEVMTDKATVEIPSPRAGRIVRLGAEEGETVPVGHVLVVIDESGVAGEERAATEPQAVGAESMVAGGGEAPPPSVGPAFKEAADLLKAVEATPAVRTLARELGVSLKDVQGTGPRGRIVAEDVQRAASGQPAAAEAEAAPVTVTAADEEEERIPLRGLRKRIAEAMTRSARNVPSFTFVAEADVTGVVAERERRKGEMEDQGVKLTFLSYVLAALPASIRAYPHVNASLDDEHQEVVVKKRVHVAVAVATPDGLTVPVIHDADQKDLVELAREVERLAEAARVNKLTTEELSGATFTVTTTGSKGGVLATPIVHHPQVAILGVHAISRKPVVRDGEIVIRDMVNLSLSVDHRVIDGQVAADFLYDVVQNLERTGGGENR